MKIFSIKINNFNYLFSTRIIENIIDYIKVVIFFCSPFLFLFYKNKIIPTYFKLFFF